MVRRALKPRRARRLIYYWVYGLENGRRVIAGPFLTETEAYQEAYAKLSGHFEIRALDTSDIDEASRRFRYRVLGETGDVEETFKYFRHKI